MIKRFSLYGVLKNQQYYEPFLILLFLDKGLSYFVIGILIGFRAVCINLMELPSGAVADLYGRRRCMVMSLSAYILSFITFAVADQLAWLFVAMFCFSVGEAFRSGTHKAIIFDWLQREGQLDRRSEVYGTTRSWAKVGSALSAVIAACIVFATTSYEWVFWAACVPYVIGIFNLLSYPKYLEGRQEEKVTFRQIVAHLRLSLSLCIRPGRLRHLLSTSMILTGTYNSTKTYLQPLLRQSALVLPVFVGLAERQRIALLAGVTYSIIHLLEAISSRQAHRVEQWRGSGPAALRWLGFCNAALFCVMAAGFGVGINVIAIVAFVGLNALQNLWMPVMLSQLYAEEDRASGATLLSAHTQLKSIFTMIAAPTLGWAVDQTGIWIVGVTGLAMAAVLILLQSASPNDETAVAHARAE